MVLDRKSSQQYPVNAGVLEGSILGPTFFLMYINDVLDDAIFNIVSMLIILSTLSVIRHLICNLWQ